MENWECQIFRRGEEGESGTSVNSTEASGVYHRRKYHDTADTSCKHRQSATMDFEKNFIFTIIRTNSSPKSNHRIEEFCFFRKPPARQQDNIKEPISPFLRNPPLDHHQSSILTWISHTVSISRRYRRSDIDT